MPRSETTTVYLRESEGPWNLSLQIIDGIIKNFKVSGRQRGNAGSIYFTDIRMDKNPMGDMLALKKCLNALINTLDEEVEKHANGD